MEFLIPSNEEPDGWYRVNMPYYVDFEIDELEPGKVQASEGFGDARALDLDEFQEWSADVCGN